MVVKLKLHSECLGAGDNAETSYSHLGEESEDEAENVTAVPSVGVADLIDDAAEEVHADDGHRWSGEGEEDDWE